eukprot:8705444-Alexandrium_andersonii.AAC.1
MRTPRFAHEFLAVLRSLSGRRSRVSLLVFSFVAFRKAGIPCAPTPETPNDAGPAGELGKLDFSGTPAIPVSLGARATPRAPWGTRGTSGTPGPLEGRVGQAKRERPGGPRIPGCPESFAGGPATLESPRSRGRRGPCETRARPALGTLGTRGASGIAGRPGIARAPGNPETQGPEEFRARVAPKRAAGLGISGTPQTLARGRGHS